MTDFLEVVGSETGRRIMMNMAHVTFVKEIGNGQAEFWVLKGREYTQVTPKETYGQIRAAMNVQEGR